MIDASICFIPIQSILCEKLPFSVGVIFNFKFAAAKMEKRNDECTSLLIAYYQISLLFSVVVGALGSSLSPLLS